MGIFFNCEIKTAIRLEMMYNHLLLYILKSHNSVIKGLVKLSFFMCSGHHTLQRLLIIVRKNPYVIGRYANVQFQMNCSLY